MSTALLEQIDAALGRYYKLLGRNDYFPSNASPKQGKFLLYCSENGYDDDDSISDDFVSLDDCLFLEMDDNFPLNPPIKNNNNKWKIKVFNVLKKCHDDPNAYLIPIDDDQIDDQKTTWKPPPLNDQFFKIKKKQLEKLKQLYKTQCSAIYETGLKADDSLMQIMAIGHKHKFPYLQYLADMYARDRIKHWCKYRHKSLLHPSQYKDLNEAIWVNKNLHLRKLKSLNSKYSDMAKASVHGFYHRVSPKLKLPTLTKIYDDIEKISNYILSSNQFVISLTTHNVAASLPPFQFDFSIVVRESKVYTGTVVDPDDNLHDTDSSGSDDTGSGSDSDSDNDNDVKSVDVIGNICAKLSVNKLHNYRSSIKLTGSGLSASTTSVHGSGTGTATRLITIAYNKYLKLIKNVVNYPQYHRFCAIIDRRNDAQSNNYKIDPSHDELTFYSAPVDCSIMSVDHVPEWYLNSSKQCIIPGVNYKNQNQNDATTITAQSACNGQLLTISYHVEAVDEIRCYLYHSGKITRFMPNDINDILPDLFDQTIEKNKKWRNSDKAKRIIDLLNLPDPKFDAFLKTFSSKNKQKK